MDRPTIAILAAGLLCVAVLFFVSIYLAGIALVVLGAIVMVLLIMQDSACLPGIDARLRADAKAVILTNTGNSPALAIHVALVPINIEYDVDRLDADQSHEYPLTAMMAEAKAVVTFRNGKGQEFSHAVRLSSSDEFEPLRPMIPLFGWKKND